MNSADTNGRFNLGNGWIAAGLMLVVLVLVWLREPARAPSGNTDAMTETIAAPLLQTPVPDAVAPSFTALPPYSADRPIDMPAVVPAAAPATPAVRSFDDVAEALLDAVVSIRTPSSSGTGFFVSANHIITNEHVIAGENFVEIRSAAGAAHAGVVRSSVDLDLALLYTNTPINKGATLKFAQTLNVRSGQDVIAIGNPRSLTATITRGVVSGVRQLNGLTWVQTDAAINGGNSGGPLIDATGLVVGVNTFKIARNEGLGFAIASDHVRAFVEGQTQPRHPSIASSDSILQRMDEATERAEEYFERAVVDAALQADRMDELWARYKIACRDKYTLATAYGRDWFGVWSAPVTLSNEDLPECRALLGDVMNLTGSIRGAMQAAEEGARRASVLPGTRRDIRRRYRMDWIGWDR